MKIIPEGIAIDQFTGHDGFGWYYWWDEYKDEGCVGAFKTKLEAVVHARESTDGEMGDPHGHFYLGD